MSVSNPLLTESGFELLTESGSPLLTESYTGYVSAQPYAALITSEHNQKPKFMNLVNVLCAGLGDVTALLQSIPEAFNLNGGAQGTQLDILGQWIGQSRIIPSILVPGFFGMSELSTGLPDGLQLPFGELTNPSIGGIWYDFGAPYNGTTTLNDSQYTTILNARIVRNQSSGTFAAMEAALLDIFGVPCQVIDNGNLTISLIVGSPVSAVDQALINQLDILPRPAGVRITGITYLSNFAVAPAFAPGPGSYSGGQVEISITCPTPGARIYVSVNGPPLTVKNGTLLPGNILNIAFIGNSLVLAIAAVPGYAASPVTSGTYIVTQ